MMQQSAAVLGGAILGGLVVSLVWWGALDSAIEAKVDAELGPMRDAATSADSRATNLEGELAGCRARRAGECPLHAETICAVGKKVGFQAAITTTYTKPDPHVTRDLWYVSCQADTRECHGAYLMGLHKMQRGEPIGALSFGDIRGATLLSVTGQRAVIQWGEYRTFTIDLAADRVTYSESGEGLLAGPTEGRGEATCGYRPPPSGQVR